MATYVVMIALGLLMIGATLRVPDFTLPEWDQVQSHDIMMWTAAVIMIVNAVRNIVGQIKHNRRLNARE